MRRVASTGHEVPLSISEEYADIHAPLDRECRSLPSDVRATGVCRPAAPREQQRKMLKRSESLAPLASALVAKLQSARATLIELLIRGVDEHGTYRGCGPQHPG